MIPPRIQLLRCRPRAQVPRQRRAPLRPALEMPRLLRRRRSVGTQTQVRPGDPRLWQARFQLQRRGQLLHRRFRLQVRQTCSGSSRASRFRCTRQIGAATVDVPRPGLQFSTSTSPITTSITMSRPSERSFNTIRAVAYPRWLSANGSSSASAKNTSHRHWQRLQVNASARKLRFVRDRLKSHPLTTRSRSGTGTTHRGYYCQRKVLRAMA